MGGRLLYTHISFFVSLKSRSFTEVGSEAGHLQLYRVEVTFRFFCKHLLEPLTRYFRAFLPFNGGSFVGYCGSRWHVGARYK